MILARASSVSSVGLSSHPSPWKKTQAGLPTGTHRFLPALEPMELLEALHKSHRLYFDLQPFGGQLSLDVHPANSSRGDSWQDPRALCPASLPGEGAADA